MMIKDVEYEGSLSLKKNHNQGSPATDLYQTVSSLL